MHKTSREHQIKHKKTHGEFYKLNRTTGEGIFIQIIGTPRKGKHMPSFKGEGEFSEICSV